MENQVYYENFDKTNTDLLNKSDIRKFLLNTNLIRLESELKLDNFHYSKATKPFYQPPAPPKHSIDDILGIKRDNAGIATSNDSDSDSLCNVARCPSSDSRYKSGM